MQKKYFINALAVALLIISTVVFPSKTFASAPTLTNGSNVSGFVSTVIPITGLQVTGTGNPTVSVHLFISTGTLSMSTTTGITGDTTGSNIYFSGTLTNINNALATLTYTGSSTGIFSLESSLVSEGQVYYPGNGHIYEVVNAGDTITATDAKAAADARFIGDVPGYLATITSPEENDYIVSQLQGSSVWFGASDADVEGDWRWIDGPETGQQFWTGLAFEFGGQPFGEMYSNWSFLEPNQAGDEDCGQFYPGNGKWNDLSCSTGNVSSYVVEYGAPGNLPSISSDSLNVTVMENPTIAYASPTPADASSQTTNSVEVKLNTSDSASGHYAVTDWNNSLIDWWRFENNTTDDSNGSFGPVWEGTAAYSSGKFGNAGSFDGTSAVATQLRAPVDSSFTVSAWVYLNSLTEAAAIISDDTGHLLQIGGSNRWQFDNVYSADSVATTGTWTHVVGVYNALTGTESLYVNGADVIDGGGSRSISRTISIGKRTDNIYLDGKIDDVMIFNRALGADEVSSLYDGAGNQYDHTFTNLNSGNDTFTGYVVDTNGNKSSTAQRSVTLVAPVLTEITPIPANISAASDAKYYFAVSGDTTGYEYLVEECGAEVQIDPINHILSLSGLQVGHTYGNCNFGMYSETGPATNSLHVGPVTLNNSATTSGYMPVVATTLASPTLGGGVTCPVSQQLTQNLHAPSKNGKYSKYTKGIVKEANILQAHLNRLGFSSGPEDGILGRKSDAAIKRMQKYLGTKQDGLVGPVTRGLINNSCGVKNS